MKEGLNTIKELKEKEPRHYNAISVSPSMESYKHPSGLHWDTRLKVIAAVTLYESGRTDRIVVSGQKVREMRESLALLMKKELIKRGVPQNVIDTEEYTFDTSTQVEWLKNNLEHYKNNMGLVTDPEQEKYFKELFKGFEIGEDKIEILNTENIMEKSIDQGRNTHYLNFFEEIHKSPYWKKWKAREKILTLFAKYFDHKGKLLQKITSLRRNSDNK